MVHLDSKISDLKSMLADLTHAIANETKSTVGDKHETTRVQMQLEQEKLQKQLHEIILQKSTLERLHETQPANKIVPGCLIETNQTFIYLSVGIGKVTVNEIPVMVISPQSPLGAKFLGLMVSQHVEMNGMVYIVKSIV
jgi:hypothetical protein